VDTDLLGLLPRGPDRSWAEADRFLSRRASRTFSVLAGGADFSRAKDAAGTLYARLTKTPELFDSLSLTVDGGTAEEIAAFLHKYRYHLLDGESAVLLESGGEKELAAEALAWVYGAMTLTGLDTLDSDPFLLTERETRAYLAAARLSGGNLALRDGALASEFEGKHWVLLRGTLSAAGASLTGKRGGAEVILRAALDTADEKDAVSFVFSGFPFHSRYSAATARREITLISAVSAALILFIFLRFFRSPFPIFLILGAAAVSVASGLAAALLVFRTAHILTLVFGSTLIGISVDYAIHYCCLRTRGLGGSAERNALVKSVTLSFASSLAAFLAFLFAPYAALRQFAVFAAAGLASSCTTVMCLSFGLWKDKTETRGEERFLGGADRFLSGRFRGFVRIAPPALALAALAVVIIRPPVIKNDLRSLYAAPPELREWERIASGVMGYGSAGAYCLVLGENLEEVLEREEDFRARLEARTGARFLGASVFVPSARTQETRYQAASRLGPLAEGQYAALGFPDAAERAAALRRDYENAAGHYALPGALPVPFAEALSGLLISPDGLEESGEERRWHAVILPAEGGFDAEAARALAAEYEWAAFVNTTEDISAQLDALTRMMFVLLAAAFVLILAGLFALYRGLAALRIAAVPALGLLAALAAHSVLSLPLSFFSAAGLALVLGLGLDYMFYLREEAGGRSADAAVILSFATTSVSFGALLFSSFAPVRLLALAAVPGLAAAFAAAFLLREQREKATVRKDAAP
jgi:predicted exporter